MIVKCRRAHASSSKMCSPSDIRIWLKWPVLPLTQRLRRFLSNGIRLALASLGQISHSIVARGQERGGADCECHDRYVRLEARGPTGRAGEVWGNGNKTSQAVRKMADIRVLPGIHPACFRTCTDQRGRSPGKQSHRHRNRSQHHRFPTQRRAYSGCVRAMPHAGNFSWNADAVYAMPFTGRTSGLYL